ncbi:YceI family protein [Niabella hibiscisoli]|uniref:YceI family protein n=1 Tax=Niabella hibiscisoli TaxID=1825928 RepID=UPI001F116D87|nr:YceI family protein [Niabella hibiscisoli]MCH5715728.1 YceI family protein [Niabella hibiscisoli]
MNNKTTCTFLIVVTTSLLFGCSGPVATENKESAVTSSLPLHVDDKNYITIDTAESVVTWKGSNLLGSNTHTGYVYLSKGALLIKDNQLVGGSAEVDMNTIEDESHGRNNNLVNHLKDPDFFNVTTFPTSTIAITSVEPGNSDNIKISGNLTIKGITHPVSFPAKMEVKNGMIKADGKLVIDRAKWDVRYKSGKFYTLLADQTISDSIEFHFKIVAKKQINAKDCFREIWGFPCSERIKNLICNQSKYLHFLANQRKA